MGWMIIRDDSIWLRHINNAPELVKRAESLDEGEALDLLINGQPARFLRMNRGRDGRPTAGLKPGEGSRPLWRRMQERRGERVTIELAPVTAYDSYLRSLTPLLSEWDSKADSEAYDDLPTA